MSDEIVKTLLESLTPEQKQDLIDKILNSNVKGSESKPEPKKDEVSVTEDFKVVSNSKLESKRKQPVRYKKNTWSDDGEFRDEQVDYEKFEKTRTPRRRGKPTKKEVECHICGKVFSMNANLVYGEYVRCNRCTGR
tara:strand:- start:2981 stop:3388 length:408 start_codon:yes stop_codon:yes gene_type:complete